MDSSASGHTVAVATSATGRVRERIDVGGHPWKLVLTPNGSMLYALTAGTTSENDVVPVDLETGRAGSPMRFQYGVSDIVIAPGGRTAYILASTGADSKAVVPLDVTSGRKLAGIPVPEDSRALAMAPRGDVLYVGGGSGGVRPSGTVEEITLAAPEASRRIAVDHEITTLSVAPDGRALYALWDDSDCTDDGECTRRSRGVSALDVTDGRETMRTETDSGPVALALSNDGETLYVLTAEAGLVPVNVTTGNRGSTISVTRLFGDPASADIVMAKDGKSVYVANANKGVAVIPIPLSCQSHL